MPVIGIAGKADFSNYYIPLSSAVTATNLADARKQGGVFAYGDFITIVINFLIVAARDIRRHQGGQHLNPEDLPRPLPLPRRRARKSNS